MYSRPIGFFLTWPLNLIFLGRSSQPNPSFVYAVSVTHNTSSWHHRNAACLCFQAKRTAIIITQSDAGSGSAAGWGWSGCVLEQSCRSAPCGHFFQSEETSEPFTPLGCFTSLCRTPKNFPFSPLETDRTLCLSSFAGVFSVFSGLQTEQQCVVFGGAKPGSYRHPAPATKLARHKE